MQLKEKVIEKLDHLEESFLAEILHLIEFHQETKPYQLSAVEKEAIQEGIEDIEAGNFHTNEAVEKEMLEWLKK